MQLLLMVTSAHPIQGGVNHRTSLFRTTHSSNPRIDGFEAEVEHVAEEECMQWMQVVAGRPSPGTRLEHGYGSRNRGRPW